MCRVWVWERRGKSLNADVVTQRSTSHVSFERFVI